MTDASDESFGVGDLDLSVESDSTTILLDKCFLLGVSTYIF